MRSSFALLGVVIISGCAHVKMNKTVAAGSNLRLSSHAISATVYQIGMTKRKVRPDVQAAIKDDLESALAEWGGIAIDDVGPNDDLTYETLGPMWNDGPVGKIIHPPIAPPLGSGPRLVIWVSAKAVSRWVQTGEVAGDVLMLGAGGGGGGRFDVNEANLIWAIIMPGGKIAAVGREDGEFVDQEAGRQALISKTMREIQRTIAK